ncbi:SpaH/EbpB family LPXTG-anchored major pilin [Enterococcus sp. 669A]|uniref:SpaH/EbpB family LPXTG-anchored major pilin n=1 Tax=Candidatus Enterococcus moelleringii TaxID=2815325 RepID=A0ABS3LA19_9ENTE|nr:SpaH/EbpB family LPXTG-anchored major pilin [Enterococcus sp. 669A]MBO1306461.1 SpaH/EbpB family LPXTG-anchored major pilin [Enterococcus sp. 669A]
MVKSKNWKRLLTGLMAAVTLAPVALAFGTGTASAADAGDPVTINVHKYMYEDGTVKYDPTTGEVTKEGAYFENDGTVQTPKGTGASDLKPFDPAKVINLPGGGTTTLGNVEFTLVDITDYAKNKTEKDILDTLKTSGKYDPTLYANFITNNVTAGTTPDKKVINTVNTPASFTNVATGGAAGKIYMILETAAGPYVTQRTIPMIVHLPFTNAAGDGYLDDIHLYGKNQITQGELDFTKYSENMDAGSELSNAVFNLYKGTAGSGQTLLNDGTWGAETPANKAKQFKTGTDGKLTPSITGLEVGSYYLVEIGFDVSGVIQDKDGNGNLKSPNALNDADNKLGFTIAAGDTGKKEIKFVNFIKPDVEKDVENGASSGNHNFNVGDTINYVSKITVPTDINGGKILPDGTISKPYTKFVFKDTAVKGLTSNVTALTDVKFFEADGTTPIVFTEPTDLDFDVSDPTAPGYTVDFFELAFKAGGNIKNFAGKEIIVKYSMTINEEAVIDKEQLNTVDLDYSNGPVTDNEHDTEKVYTGGYKWQKYGEEAADQDGLDGAEFIVMNNITGDPDNGKYLQSDPMVSGEVKWGAESTAFKFTSKTVDGVKGVIAVGGLEYGKYQLKETKAPNTYQKLVNPIDFEVTSTSWTDSLVGGIYQHRIENKEKPELPITGGMGTMIFTVLGLTVMGAAVLYTVKNRRKAA